MIWKMKKTTWVFIFQKYGKFWSVLLRHFINHKPLISEECCTHICAIFSLMRTLWNCEIASYIVSSNFPHYTFSHSIDRFIDTKQHKSGEKNHVESFLNFFFWDMAKKLQRQIDNTFKAVAVMLPSPILNLGRVSSF